MNSRRLFLCGVGLILIGLPLPAAVSQYARKLEGLVDRPTTNAPSALLGGTYTRQAAQPLAAARESNVALLTQRMLPSRASMRDYRYGRGLTYGQTGLMEDSAAFPRSKFFDVMTGAFRSRHEEIGFITGMNAATSLALPVPGVAPRGLPTLTASAYTPRPRTERFHDLLGLIPARSAEPLSLLPSAPERLDARTDDVALRAQREGLTLFKQGTIEQRDPRTGYFEKCLDCSDKLAAALRRLRMASDLDGHAALPVLLSVHAALEQDRPLLAASNLVEALRREPRLLLEDGAALDPFFGDATAEGERSAFLAAQMRRYARTGTFNPDSVLAYALEAYCAWRLGESGPARTALTRVEELARASTPEEAEALQVYVAGLRAALQ